MKTHQPKLKQTPRPLFSCGFFRHCTQTVVSPTTSTPPTLPIPHSDPPPPPPRPSSDPRAPQPESESSSSSNTSQSFTQWRFPLPTSPISYPPTETAPPRDSPSSATTQKSDPPPSLLPVITSNFQELFHVAELQLSTSSDSDRVRALHMLERSLVPNAGAATDDGDAVACPAAVMRGVVEFLKDRVGAKPASKVLLALCLVESNRHIAVEVGAVAVVVEALADMEGAATERALAALELLCTVEEGAAEVRSHALAVPMMVGVMDRMGGRGKESAISVLAVIFGGSGEKVAAAPLEQVARAAVLAMQGDCSVRGKRKVAQLLKILQDNERLDLTQ